MRLRAAAFGVSSKASTRSAKLAKRAGLRSHPSAALLLRESAACLDILTRIRDVYNEAAP
jgi:hypothetical protein